MSKLETSTVATGGYSSTSELLDYVQMLSAVYIVSRAPLLSGSPCRDRLLHGQKHMSLLQTSSKQSHISDRMDQAPALSADHFITLPCFSYDHTAVVQEAFKSAVHCCHWQDIFC